MVYMYCKKPSVSHYKVSKSYTQNFLNFDEITAQVWVKSAINRILCVAYTVTPNSSGKPGIHKDHCIILIF